jgi:hypothetical protein
MLIVNHILWGIVAIVTGVTSIKFNYQLVGFTGRQDWIESKLGSGSTYFVFKMLSILIIAFGILYATGLWDPIGRILFAPLTNALAPGSTHN